MQFTNNKMLHRSISIGLITVFVPNNHSSRFGIKLAAAKNRHQQQREYENNGYRRQQQQKQQNPYGNGFGGGFGGGGDPFAGSGQVASDELYNYLNVTPDATEKEIKSSYRKLALEVRLLNCTVSSSLSCTHTHPYDILLIVFCSFILIR